MTVERHWLARPATIRRLWALFVAVLVAIVLVELLIAPEAHFPVERLFAFNAWFGFGACAALIIVAKALGVLLKRPDDFYGDEAGDA